jgi:hypothetical protein
MLLILFWVSFLMFYFSYLFSVLFLVFLVMFLILVYFANIIYVKYLVVLVYSRGVVIFILYISCICWNIKINFSLFFIIFALTIVIMFDSGVIIKFSDIGEFFWMYLFFSRVFSLLVTIYSLNLFKTAGSLRF